MTNKSVEQIHTDLYNATINSKPLKKYLKQITSKAVNLPQKNKEDNFILLLLREFKKGRSVIIRETLVDTSGLIDDMLKNTDKCFWVASKHLDSAKDHRAYQGKIYFNNKSEDKEAREYAVKKHMVTVQWVTGKPVYFCTRPNCRHYFEQFTLESILKKDYYIPHRQVGEREMGSPRKKEYEERLDMLQELWEIKPTDLLRRQIEKTKFLIKRNA